MIDLPWWPASVNAGEVTYPPGGTYGPRTQRDYQLVALHAGHVRVTVNGTAYRFEQGSVFLLRPGRREFFQFAEECATRQTWVAARVPAMPEAMLRGMGTAPPSAPLSAELQALMRLVIALPPPLGSPGGGEPARSLARAALAYFWHEAGLGQDAAGATPPEPVLRAVDCVRRRLGDPLALSDLARAAAVTPEHLCRLFGAELGTTPMAYLWGQRTREGLRLLSGTGLSIQEISVRCGFRTTFHFARRVRRAAGTSPTGYRVAHWNPEPHDLAAAGVPPDRRQT